MSDPNKDKGQDKKKDDDERIFADLVATLERDGAQVRLALGWLDDAAGGCLADLPDAARQGIGATAQHRICPRDRPSAMPRHFDGNFQPKVRPSGAGREKSRNTRSANA